MTTTGLPCVITEGFSWFRLALWSRWPFCHSDIGYQSFRSKGQHLKCSLLEIACITSRDGFSFGRASFCFWEVLVRYSPVAIHAPVTGVMALFVRVGRQLLADKVA